MFETLKAEEAIHRDIKKYKTSAKAFCEYFYLRFFGADFANEMKNSKGFILRGLKSQHILSLQSDIEALYKNNIKIKFEGDKLPEEDGPDMICYLEKIVPFTQKKRQLYHISESEMGISKSMSND